MVKFALCLGLNAGVITMLYQATLTLLPLESTLSPSVNESYTQPICYWKVYLTPILLKLYTTLLLLEAILSPSTIFCLLLLVE